MNFKTAVIRQMDLPCPTAGVPTLRMEHSVNCRTVLQTDVLPFRIGKQGEEFAPGGYTCVLSASYGPDLEIRYSGKAFCSQGGAIIF